MILWPGKRGNRTGAAPAGQGVKLEQSIIAVLAELVARVSWRSAEYVRSWLHLRSALRATVVHPCSCALNYLRGTAAVCLRRAVHDATTPRARGQSTQHAAIRESRGGTNSDVECTGAPCDWPLLPSAQRRPKSGKNESGRLPGFQLTRTDSPVRLAVYCTLRQLSPVAVYSCAVSRSCRGSSLTPLTCSQFQQKHRSYP